MYAKLGGGLSKALSPYTQEDRAAAARRAKREAQLIHYLGSLGLQQPDPLQNDQIDVHEQARRLMALHMCNAELRRQVWCMSSPAASEQELGRVLLTNRRARTFGEEQAVADDPSLIPSGFWPVFFEFNQLPEWCIRLGDRQTGVEGAIVLKNTTYLFRTATGRRVLMHTAAIVHFYQQLLDVFPFASAELQRDLVLLYFVSTCLLKKNGRQVLERSYHIGPRLREYTQILEADYQNAMSVYERQRRLGMLKLTRLAEPAKPTDQLELMWQVLRTVSPPVCDVPTERQDFITMSDVVQTWGNLLFMMNCHLPARYEAVPAAKAASPSLFEMAATAAQEVEEEKGTAPTTSAEEAQPEAVEEQATQEEERPLPPVPSSDEDRPLPPAPSSEGEADLDNPPAPPQRADRQIKCGRCQYMASNLCSTQCVARRLGSPIAGKMAAAPVSVQSAAQTNNSAGVRHIASQLGSGSDQNATAAMSIVITSLTPQTPVARGLILARQGVPQLVAARVQPARTTTEWCELVKPLAALDTDSTARLEQVDDLASRCGWMGAPIGERLARYTTVMGAPSWQDAFVHNRWARTAKIDREIAQFVAERPAVPLRTLQLVASALTMK